jgi:nucleotide-binding universal stress UspA family protein
MPCRAPVISEFAGRSEDDMPIQSILVAWDGSEPSRRALALAEDLAGQYGARLLLVTVLDPTPVPAGALVPLSPFPTPDDLERTRQELQQLTKELLARGRSIEAEVQVGPVAERIRELADRYGVSLIVAGRSGKGAFARLLLGSVTTALLHTTTRPITVVP